jgi:hypothetical protein
MRSYKFATLFCVVYALSVASRAAEPALVLEPAYVEQTNGLFAVCAYDRTTGIMFRYKGVFISKEQLPAASIMRPNLIFASQTTRESATNAVDSWNPRQEDLYNYNTMPYPIEDIDPAIELCKTAASNVVLGVRLRERFYAFETLESPVNLKKVNLPIHDAKSHYVVVPVHCPDHRGNEIKAVLDILK